MCLLYVLDHSQLTHPQPKRSSDYHHRSRKSYDQEASLLKEITMDTGKKQKPPNRDHLINHCNMPERKSTKSKRDRPVTDLVSRNNKEPPNFSDVSPDVVRKWIRKNLTNSDDFPKYLPIFGNSNLEYVRKDGGFVYLGGGVYGDVYLCKLRSSGKLVAVKMIKSIETDLSNLIKECALQLQFNNTRCTSSVYGLAIMEISDTYMPLGMVSEFIGDERTYDVYNIYKLLAEERTKRLTTGEEFISNIEWMRICIRIARCVNTVHSRNVVINDIKADNILLRRKGGTWVPVLIDFGMAGVGECPAPVKLPRDQLDTFMRNHSHIAPEFVLRQKTSKESDIYSLGMLFRCMVNSIGLSDLERPATLCSNQTPEVRVDGDGLIDMLRCQLNGMIV